MSVRNTRKNLGTVIECAENVEDSSSLSSNNKRKDNNAGAKKLVDAHPNQPTKIKEEEQEEFLKETGDEDQTSYESACSSADNNNRLTVENLNCAQSSTNSVAVDMEVTSHGRSSADDSSEYEEAEEEEKDDEEIVVLPPLPTAPTKIAAGTSANSSTRKKVFAGAPGGGAFSHSRLSLITFLNNIATPSIRSPAIGAPAHYHHQSKKPASAPLKAFSSTAHNDRMPAGSDAAERGRVARHAENRKSYGGGGSSGGSVCGISTSSAGAAAPIAAKAAERRATTAGMAPCSHGANVVDETTEESGDRHKFSGGRHLSADSSNCRQTTIEAKNVSLEALNGGTDMMALGLSTNCATEPMIVLGKASPNSMDSVNLTSNASKLSCGSINNNNCIITNTSAMGLSNSSQANGANAMASASSGNSTNKITSSAAYNTKNCDKISTTSDLTLASVISTSSTSNNSSTVRSANSTGGGKHKSRECVVCCTRHSASNFMRLINCGHRCCCKNCLIKYLNVEIMESRTSISCPQCSELLHVNDIYSILEKHSFLLEKYECFSLRRVLSTDADTRWCPAPDCTYAVIASACAACPQLECKRPGCGTMFCYHCKSYWHANQTCDQARDRRFPPLPFSSPAGARGNGGSSTKASKGADGARSDTVKSCPRCGALIVKMNDGSCNHMTCALCGVEFCWLCLKQINELHYISPTGCTFWGKKPWTRKKKLLWQIGTLIGAPLGIALIAGLAVPGIICGVPIFIGRKTYQRFSTLSRTRRHLVTAVSVAGSLLISPVLAVMAVGVGVPIMLAYVYGVVPLSLCRNGGCGSGTDASDMSEAPYGTEEGEDLALLTSEGQERSRLIRALREDVAGPSGVSSVSATSSRSVNVRRNRQKQCLEITVSDRSSASSPSGAFCVGLGNSFRKKSRAVSRLPSTKAKSTATGGGDLNSSDVYSAGGGGGCSVSRVISTGSQRQVHRTHRRQQSNESGVMSLGDKLNTEDASMKAIAGSQYNYDDRSVHTIWSSGGGVHHAPAADIASNYHYYYNENEDNASMKACGGSVMEARSLAESGTSSTLPHLALLSRERDISPTNAPAAARSSCAQATAQKSQQQLGSNEFAAKERNCQGGDHQSASPSPPLLSEPKSNYKKSSCSTSCDELRHYPNSTNSHHYQQQSSELSDGRYPVAVPASSSHMAAQHKNSHNQYSASFGGGGGIDSAAGGDFVAGSVKKASIGTLPSTSQKSAALTCSSMTSMTSSTCSNFSSHKTMTTTPRNVAIVGKISGDNAAAAAKNRLELGTDEPRRQERSRISLRKLIRRPIDLFTGRSSSSNYASASTGSNTNVESGTNNSGRGAKLTSTK